MKTISIRELHKRTGAWVRKAAERPTASPSCPRGREERNARDIDILNRRAGRLNREAADVLAYQLIPEVALDVED